MRYIAFRKHDDDGGGNDGDADSLYVDTTAPPVVGADELLIGVAASGLNRADIQQRRGKYPPPPGASPILGLEVAGTVIAKGADVSGWSVGDAVCALCDGGGYAEQVSVAAGQCLPIPAGLSMAQAAALPEACFTVWFNVFEHGALREGESLLVHGGSSGIGVTAIQMAAGLGARVFVTAGSEEKCRACLDLGAERAVNYRQQDFVEELREATGGSGVDVILDMVAGEYVNRNLELAARDGRVVNIAIQLGFKVEINILHIMSKRLVLTGSTLRPQSRQVKAGIAAAVQQNVWPLLERGEMRPVIAASFPFEEAAAAHKLMESSRHIGKIVLDHGVGAT